MSEKEYNNILAIDCAASEMKLGFQFGGDRLVKSTTEAKQSHSALIVEKIQSLIESAGGKVADINAIVVATGPGSFTGLRIGIACAKGMAVALDIPVVAVNLFEIAAYKLSKENSKVMILLPFKKDALFTAVVEKGRVDGSSVTAVSKTDLTGHINGLAVAGIGVEITTLVSGASKIIDGDSMKYDASELIFLGMEKLNRGESADLTKLEPLYVQKSQAEIKFERNQSQTN